MRDRLNLGQRDKTFVSQKIAENNPWYTERQSSSRFLARRRYKLIYREKLLTSLIYKLQPKQGKLKLLDADCGDGLNLEFLQHIPFLETWGCDYNPKRTKVAQARFPKSHIFQADLLDTNAFEANSFDIVFNCHVIEHIPEHELLLKSFAHLLKPNGKLILATPNEGCLFAKSYKYFSENNGAKTDHVHFYTDHSIREQLFKENWQVEHFYPESFFFPHARLAAWIASSPFGTKCLQQFGNLFPSQCAGLVYLLSPTNT